MLYFCIIILIQVIKSVFIHDRDARTLFVCEGDKSEISLHKLMVEVSSGQGIKWKKEDYGIYVKADTLLEKTEKNEVCYRAKLFCTIRVTS